VPARQTSSLLGRKRHQVGQRFLIIGDDFDIPRVIAIKLLRPFEVTYVGASVPVPQALLTIGVDR
jgi:hypothetical protein